MVAAFFFREHFFSFKFALSFLIMTYRLRFCLFTVFLLMVFSVDGQAVFPGSYIRTSGKLPQLAWSGGADRLGSSKMGYIDTGIVMKVTDTLGGLLKVELAQNRHAYLGRNFATPLAGTIPVRPVTAESWTVRGEARHDLVAINVGSPVPYQSWMETGPANIVVELYGVQANTNWITQLQSAKVVDWVDFRQVDDDVMRVTIRLNTHHYGYRIGYQGRQLQLQIRHTPENRRLRGKTIVIDAGHGGTNTGARGVNSGILEKDYNLLFARALEKNLKRKGAIVKMIRDTDSTVDTKDRVLWSQAQDPDIFISFHLNSSSRATAKGASTYYKHLAFSGLNRAILSRMLRIDGLEEFGLIGSFNFQPVQPTDYPSSLVEVAFLSNVDDEKLILDPRFHKKVGKRVRQGIQDWLSSLK